MNRSRPPHPPGPRGVLCPYCGSASADAKRCASCGGYFDPLSRQATQNAMGPWFVRDEAAPFRPGCSYETLKELVRRGRIGPTTVIRGPTTRQFWNLAGRTPSVANLLGLCHNCRAEVNPDEFNCRRCGAAFTPETDRQHLGLAPVHLLPGRATPETIAAAVIEAPAREAPPGPMPPAFAAADTGVSAAGRPTNGTPYLRQRLVRQRVAIVVLLIAVLALASFVAALMLGPPFGLTLVAAPPAAAGDDGNRTATPAAPSQGGVQAPVEPLRASSDDDGTAEPADAVPGDTAAPSPAEVGPAPGAPVIPPPAAGPSDSRTDTGQAGGERVGRPTPAPAEQRGAGGGEQHQRRREAHLRLRRLP